MSPMLNVHVGPSFANVRDSAISMISDCTGQHHLVPRFDFGRSTNSTEQLQSTAKAQSTKTFETSLYLNAAVFALELLAFTLLRQRFKAIYEPRTYIPSEK